MEFYWGSCDLFKAHAITYNNKFINNTYVWKNVGCCNLQGNSEGQTQFDPVVFPWSAFHSDDFGYTRMKVVNSSVLQLEQVSTKNSQVTHHSDSDIFYRLRYVYFLPLYLLSLLSQFCVVCVVDICSH